jgi:hypothetical protein
MLGSPQGVYPQRNSVTVPWIVLTEGLVLENLGAAANTGNARPVGIPTEII